MPILFCIFSFNLHLVQSLQRVVDCNLTWSLHHPSLKSTSKIRYIRSYWLTCTTPASWFLFYWYQIAALALIRKVFQLCCFLTIFLLVRTRSLMKFLSNDTVIILLALLLKDICSYLPFEYVILLELMNVLLKLILWVFAIYCFVPQLQYTVLYVFTETYIFLSEIRWVWNNWVDADS
jgi:hypothetical protein